ncbi:hypothetical protein BHE74_00040421 [Ensete ventricosum]|nr:hypothetical protein BHE74_00040421 [Ensete ventricosum]
MRRCHLDRATLLLAFRVTGYEVVLLRTCQGAVAMEDGWSTYPGFTGLSWLGMLDWLYRNDMRAPLKLGAKI